MPTRKSTIPLVLACVLALSACAPAGEIVDDVEIVVPDIDPENLPTELPYGSGMLDIFDDAVELDPELAPFRDRIAQDDAAFGEKITADASGSLADPVALPAPAPIGRTRGAARTAGDDVAAGSYLIGSFAGTVISMSTGSEQVQKLAVGQVQTNDDKTLSVTRSDANNVNVEMTQQQETTENGATVKTDFRVKMEGKMCPNADGEFDVRFRVHHGVSGGSGAGATEELIASLTGRLGENSYPEQMHLSTSHRSTETRADGSTITVATRQQNDATDLVSFFSTAKAPVELIERSDGVSDAEMKRLTERGQGRAASMLFGQVISMIMLWSNGGCVRIDASAPAVVKPSSVTDIPVGVVTKLGGEEVSAKVTIALEGAEKVSTGEVQTPNAAFQYTASDEVRTSAKIELKATSRRGGASLTLPISTGASHYAVTGGSGIWAGTGEWCEGASAFSVVGNGGTTVFELFGVDGGNMRGVGADPAVGGYDLSGTWTVQTDDKDQPTGIYADYAGTHYTLLAQPVPYSTTMSFTLTPKESCDAA